MLKGKDEGTWNYIVLETWLGYEKSFKGSFVFDMVNKIWWL